MRRVGIEDVLILAGTALLAAGAWFVSPAAPLFVVGAICLAWGVAIAVSAARRSR